MIMRIFIRNAEPHHSDIDEFWRRQIQSLSVKIIADMKGKLILACAEIIAAQYRAVTPTIIVGGR